MTQELVSGQQTNIPRRTMDFEVQVRGPCSDPKPLLILIKLGICVANMWSMFWLTYYTPYIPKQTVYVLRNGLAAMQLQLPLAQELVFGCWHKSWFLGNERVNVDMQN